MLSRAYRLTSKDYSIYRKGKIINTSLFSIKIIDNNESKTKLGVIIGKKFLKNKSQRNFLKRRISHYYTNICDKLNNKIVIITFINKENINKSPSYDRIVEDLNKIL